MTTEAMLEKLKEKEDQIRKQIQMELRVKEGAENLRKAHVDKQKISSEIKK